MCLCVLLTQGVARRCFDLQCGGAKAPFATLVKASDWKDDLKVPETFIDPRQILLAI